MIELQNVSYVYDENSPMETPAVKDVSLTIEDGEFWGIIGHTGSGKSTLCEMMCGLVKPTGGKVMIDKVDIASLKNVVKSLKGKVGMVFQYPDHQLFEESVIKDIAFGPCNLGFDEDECILRAKNAMKMVALGEEYEEKSPFELSGGEKKRVTIASILAMDPEVLILDEPTAGLDPKGREDIINLLVEIHKTGKSIVLISHSMEDIAYCCDKVLVMNRGEVFLQGEVREVFDKVDMLDKVGLDIPQITRLMHHVKSMGHDVKTDVLTVEEAVEELYKLIKES